MLYKKPIKQIRLACVLIVISCAQCMQATMTSFRDFTANQNKANPSNNNSHTHNKNVKHPNNNSNVIGMVNNRALGGNKNYLKDKKKNTEALSQSEYCLQCGQTTCLSYIDKSTKVKNTQCLHCDFPLSNWKCFLCKQERSKCKELVQHCTGGQHHICGLCFEGLVVTGDKCCPICNKEKSMKLGVQPINLAKIGIKSKNKRIHANYCKLSEEYKRRKKQIHKDHEIALKLSKQQKPHDVNDGALAGKKNKDKKKNTEAPPQSEYCLQCGQTTCLSYIDKGSKVENTQCLHCRFPLSTWECSVCYTERNDCEELVQNCTGKNADHYLCNVCFKRIAKSETKHRCPICNKEGSMKQGAQPINLANLGIKPKGKENRADYWKLSKEDKRKQKQEAQQRNEERINADQVLARRLANGNIIAPNFNGDRNEVDFGMGIFPPNDALGGNNNQLNRNNGAVIQGNHDRNRFGPVIGDDNDALALIAALQGENINQDNIVQNNVNNNDDGRLAALRDENPNNDGGALGGNNNQLNRNNGAVIQGNHDRNRFGPVIGDDNDALALIAALRDENPNNDGGALGGNNNNQLNRNNVNLNNENVLINNSVSNLIDKVSNMLPIYVDAQNSMALIGVLVLITFTYKLLWQGSLLLASC